MNNNIAYEKKRKPSTSDQNRKRAFKRKIINTFIRMGFQYIPSNNKNIDIVSREVEVDAIFIYENIWILCEDTMINKKNIKDHVRNKNEAYGEIKKNLGVFVEKLVNMFPDKANLIEKYDVDRIKVFGLYIPFEEMNPFGGGYGLFQNLRFVEPKTLNYFQWISKCIKCSAKYEVFRFLELTNKDIGMASSSQGNTEIISPIIYPKTFTGSESVRVVSFMMCAEDLLNTCYVMRKDNWSESILLYQRLIDQSKIQKVRSYLEKKGETFYNNIIVALPDSISFRSDDNNYKSVEEIIEFDKQYKLILPNEMNTICVIDGQHRIFAHYESGTQNDQEMRIAELRKERHLLVTGLIFPKDMSQEKRARIQSAIFLDINQNAKPVPPNILLQIRRIQNPIGDESLAQSVIECLNKDGVFKERLQISSLDSGKIKTASIVRFALRYLITINPPRGKKSLYSYWTGKKEDLLQKDECAIQEYVNFCTKIIKYYFAAIKKNRQEDWYDSESKLLSVISINGFIIALTRQLEINGVKDFSFYDKIFRGWSIKFSKKEFPYTSSQYRKFSTQILHDAFGFDGDTISRI